MQEGAGGLCCAAPLVLWKEGLRKADWVSGRLGALFLLKVGEDEPTPPHSHLWIFWVASNKAAPLVQELPAEQWDFLSSDAQICIRGLGEVL